MRTAAAALMAATACVQAMPSAARADGALRPGDLAQLIGRLMKGDATALESLKAGGPDVVATIERRLAASPIGPEQIDPLLDDLGDPRWQVREEATDRLCAHGAPFRQLLQNRLKAATDAEVRVRLEHVLLELARGSAAEGRQALAKALVELYGAHADALLRDRWTRFLKDPNDPAADAFMRFTPFDSLWPRMRDRPPEERLRYLLVLRWRGPWPDGDQGARLALREFPAKDVLAAAAKTYWPVEIEPLERDGAYGWTTRAAAVEGQAACNVIRMSVKMPDYGNVRERGEWVHLEHWDRWVYVFRLTHYMLNRNAVAYVERRDRPALPFHADAARTVRGRCSTVRGVPASVRVPTAPISQAEMRDWHMGVAYEWAADLFPPDLRAGLTFRKNAHTPPTLRYPPDENSPGGQ